MNENKGQVTTISNDYVEIDLIELWYLFRRKFVFILLFAILGAVIAAGITHHLIAPKYSATARIYVVSASNDSVVNLSDLQIGTNLTSDYKELILSRPMLQSCIDNLNMDCDYIQLRKLVDVSNPSGTRILNITATTTVPNASMDIANEMASLACKWLPEVMESNAPNIAEDAILPTEKSSPSLVKNTAIGGFALAFLYFAICVIKFYSDDSVKTSEEFEKYFGMVPLAAIPEEKEARR